MNSSEKGEGVPLLNFEMGPGVPLLSFEGGPEVTLLNFRGVPGPNFKFSGDPGSWISESRGPGFRGPGTIFTPCLIFSNLR